MSKGCEDPWSFFVAKGDRQQNFLGNTDVDSFLTDRSYELGNMIRGNLVCHFRFFICIDRRTNTRTDRRMLTECTVNAERKLFLKIKKKVTVISKNEVGPTSRELH